MNRPAQPRTRITLPADPAHSLESPLAEADMPSRRLVLRGALAVGCGLLLPAALPGCDAGDTTGAAGRGSPPPAPAPESAAPSGPQPDAAAASPAESAAKVSQASVQYQTHPKGEQQCATCMHFIAESNTCKLVEGEISPQGWCILWAKAA